MNERNKYVDLKITEIEERLDNIENELKIKKRLEDMEMKFFLRKLGVERKKIESFFND